MPRPGYPDQFWDGPNAELQGSHDRSSWQTVAVLTVVREEIKEAGWLEFEVSAGQPFQYYRLLIRDDNFLSLGELELLTIAEKSESSE